jgi:carbonic anhydrase
MMDDLSRSPSAAVDLLLAGNDRFVRAEAQHPNQDAARRAQTASGQHPFAVVFGCSDSRLAAEIIFDQGLGDLFVVRTAGHVAGPEVLGSIEFGVSVLGCPLVVVLGHDSCGAVAAARAGLRDGPTAGGYVRDVLERVTPSVIAAQVAGLVEEDQIIDQHVRSTVELLMDRSRILSDCVTSGRVAVLGLRYRLADGDTRIVAAHGWSAEQDRVGFSAHGEPSSSTE